MNQQKDINNILEAAVERTQNDIGGLLGVDFILAEGKSEIVSGKTAFERLAKKMICVRMDIFADIQGQGFLLIGIKDAIRLGGTLIMLPGKELSEAISREELGEEIEDSYGEIANIIAESFSRDFEEMSAYSCRFICKEQEVVVPMQVCMDSDERVQGKTYRRVSFSMALDGQQMGDLVMLLPTDTFHLLQDETDADRPTTESFQKDSAVLVSKSPAYTPGEPTTTPQINGNLQKIDRLSVAEITKFQEHADKLLAACSERVAEEVCALLGKNIHILNITNKFICRDDFFSHEVAENQVIAKLNVRGEIEVTGFLLMNLRSAIRIGGELITIPDMELESIIAAEEFAEDTVDAFSEMINIIAEVYTEIFGEQYAKRIQFTKIDLQQLDPLHVGSASIEPLQDREYYLSSMTFTMDDAHGDTIHLLLPTELFELRNEEHIDYYSGEADWRGSFGKDEEELDDPNEASKVAGVNVDSEAGATGSLDILLIHDEEAETDKIRKVLRGLGYSTRNLSFKDNLHSYLSGELKAIYLIMQDVNEQAFGAAIKVSSACSVPLIAAGPGWTRSKVIKAVKYGVCDILLTPASPDDIEKNVANNLLKFAA